MAMGFDQLSMNAGSLSVIKRVLSGFSREELQTLMAMLKPMRSSASYMPIKAKKPLFIDSVGSRICWSSGTIARWFIWQPAATRVTIECCNA